MAIGISRITGTATGVDATSFTRSYTATAGVLAIACIGAQRGSSTNPPTPTVTHNSVTATEITSLLYESDAATRHKGWIFAWDTGGGSASVNLTADYGATTIIGSEIQIYEVTGSDMINGVVQCFVQAVKTTADASGTSGAITLAAATHSNNRPFASWWHLANEDATIGNSWTTSVGINHANPNCGHKAGWLTSAYDTAAAASWTTSSTYGGIAVELKAYTGPRTRIISNREAQHRASRW